MPSPTKVLLLGMDAGDTFLIQQWAADGTLPTLRTLLDNGLVGETLSLPGFFEGSTWPSFYTGVTPAQHGFHWLTQLIPGTYKFQRCYPGDFIKCKPFWHYLSDAGRKMAILDIPLSGISRGLNGIHMVEWGSHDGVYGFHTWPASLKWEVLARFGRYPLRQPCDSIGRTPQDFQAFRNQLLEGIRRKAELSIHYLKKGNWDFFAQVFSESHCVGHQCWHLHDPQHPSYDPKTARYLGDPVRDVYKALDQAIGKIIEQTDSQTLIVFLASHRMAHTFGGNFLLEEILKQLHVTMPQTEGSPANQSSSQKNRIFKVLSQVWQKIPAPIKVPLTPVLLSLHNLILYRIRRGKLFRQPSYISHIDLAKSQCFPLQNGSPISGIRINVSGREPHGLITPGKELHDFCEELTKNLLSIVDPDTGKAMIKSVKKTFELYKGQNIDYLPDLLIEWNDEKFIGSLGVGDVQGSRLRMFSQKIGELEGVNTYSRTGDHRPEGLFVALGPGINRGRLERTVSIMDFAPTFTKLFGVEMPQMDGHPIAEILETARLPLK
jgi:predicted AlkP superfamily phosphohydrolase/phosphomutase